MDPNELVKDHEMNQSTEDDMEGKDKQELEQIGKELKRMQQRQIDNLDRQRIEHADLFGALKLEHEK